MFDKYRIKSGDSLKLIADKFNTSVDNLKDINNIEYSDSLRIGMEIVVPKIEASYYNYHTIEDGDTLYNVSKKYNINPELLALLNGLEITDFIYPNQEILIPKSEYSYYITKCGDTLKLVAEKFSVPNAQIELENETIYLLDGQLLVHKR